jgi:hypothetical protein
MPEFEKLQTEPILKKVSRELELLRTELEANPIKTNINSSENELYAAFDLGILNPADYLVDADTLTTQQLVKVAKHLSEKDDNPLIIKDLVISRISSNISLEDFYAISEGIDGFIGFDFQFIEAIGWPRIRQLLQESKKNSSTRKFYDTLVNYVASKPEHVLQSVDMLFEDTEFIEKERGPSLIQAFYRMPGVAEKITNWILRKPRLFSNIEHMVRLASSQDALSAARLLPLVEAQAQKVIFAGQRLQATILFHSRGLTRDQLYSLPDQKLATSLDWLVKDMIHSFKSNPEFQEQYHQTLDLAKDMIRSSQLTMFREIFLLYVGSISGAQEILTIYEKTDPTLRSDDKDYLTLRRLAYEQTHSTTAQFEVKLIQQEIDGGRIRGYYPIRVLSEILTEYAEEAPELVMNILEKHGKESGPDSGILALTNTLSKTSARDRITAWKNKYLQPEVKQKISPIKEYLEIQSANFERVGLQSPIDDFKGELEKLSPTEQRFISLTLKKWGLLSKQAIATLASIPETVPMQKTGSDIEVLAKRHRGVLKHTVSVESASVWVELADDEVDPTPVAPILKTNTPHESMQTLYSRICGEDLHEVLDKYFGQEWLLSEGLIMRHFNPGGVDEVTQNREKLNNILTTFGDRNPLLKIICNQALAIFDSLEKKGVDHGHPHLHNFTLEFVDTDYLENHFKSEGITVRRRAQFVTQKPTINNIPWSDAHFTFDPEIAEKDSEKWKPLVRLIDFDQARKTASR